MPGSKVSAADQGGHIAGDATTNKQGCYVISGLRPGQYDIKLDPCTANLKGDTAVSYVDAKDLTVDWAVGLSRAAIATARPGTRQAAMGNLSQIPPSDSDERDSPPGCKGMIGPPCGPKSPKEVTSTTDPRQNFTTGCAPPV
ncbi:carboxypeptidase-like regulatory domain-containing protein [Candidatus Binatus sp.]|uniref:carboxypeptidase-like regulatory domain-containing protein n=1 Tax=Candidatus Binatus sp. TaxID=2811406 RepID=UPI003CA18919